MKAPAVSVIGAGIAGLWQAYTLAFRGYAVHLVDRAKNPFGKAASAYAGAMLAPFCERETAPPIVQDLGLRSLDIWRTTFPGVVSNGTLVVAHPGDRSELIRFSRLTEGYQTLDADELAQLEPDLARRFQTGLFYAEEAHVDPAAAAGFLLRAIRRLGARVSFDHDCSEDDADYIIYRSSDRPDGFHCHSSNRCTRRLRQARNRHKRAARKRKAPRSSSILQVQFVPSILPSSAPPASPGRFK